MSWDAIMPQSLYMDEAEDMTRSMQPAPQPTQAEEKFPTPPQIWKFPLSIGHLCQISMPKGAVLRYVESQKDVLCLWAEVIPNQQKETRRFYVFGTGHDIEVGSPGYYLQYVASAMQHHGALVWHVYEEIAIFS